MSALRDLMSNIWFLPEPEMPVRVDSRGPGRRLVPGEPFTVVSWNIQFGAGRNRWFFYDRGPDVHVTPAEVEHTLAGVIALLSRVDADLVLLQEVDRNSTRTGYVDQHRRIADALGSPCVAATPYFKVPFVPVPPAHPLGKVDMCLGVYSRLALTDGVRIALSPLREPVWRRAFNLRRALMHLGVELDGGGRLQLFHTHLSAFSLGDGTLSRQVGTVLSRVRDSSGPALLAGDLNSLPPGDDPARLGFAAALYAEAETPIRPLWDGLDVLFPPRSADGAASPEGYSYVPWGANTPDRTIDYLFGRGIEVLEVEALADGAAWSDHLPIRARCVVR